MKIPLNWLQEYCNPGLDAVVLAERLDLTGTAVERTERQGVPESDGFVVGKVLERSKHPDADRLSVCTVDLGDGKPTQIVCGAPNVAAGQTVAIALPGAVLPDGTKLKKAKLRGMASAGMILSEDELGLGSTHEGIMVLTDELTAGTPLADVLPLAADLLELEITPNRPDCLSIYGAAREVHAATGAPLAAPPWAEDPAAGGPIGADLKPAGASVIVEVGELCSRFTARVFEGVKVGPSPQWLQALLLAVGQRPISNVVDITNYVMLLTGQPSHAFDLDRVVGQRLTVRRAADGEPVATLDGETHELDGEMVVICDDDGPTAIAGVKGGTRSEVSDDTTRVLVEVATWVGPNIHRTSKVLALRSEASTRFEKQLSPQSTLEAQAVITQLMTEICGATPVEGTIDVGGSGPEPAPIQLRYEHVTGLLGEEITPERCSEILVALGFELTEVDSGLEVVVPHFRRRDVTREVDLIEEIARIDGFERLPATLPARRSAVGRLSFEQKLRRRAEEILTDLGFFEVVGWSFSSPKLIERLRIAPDSPRARTVTLQNPMSEEHSIMRTTLLGSLLDIAALNLTRGTGSVCIFESGAVYQRHEHADSNGTKGNLTPADESHHIAALMVGGLGSGSWRDPEPAADFYALKGVLEGLFERLGAEWRLAQTSELSFLHPGKGAMLTVGGLTVGWIGELHPLVTAEWDIEQSVTMFGINFDLLVGELERVVHFRPFSAQPVVRQDLALVVSDDLPAARVEEVIRQAGGELLERAQLFDVFRGEQIGAGKVSLAYALSFRAADRTLTDDEVDHLREQIIAAAKSELKAVPRA